MTPSKEAIEEYWNCIALQGATADGVSKAIEAAYAIDVVPLEQRIKELEDLGRIMELEAENQEAYELIDAVFNHCYSTEVSYRMGAWIDRHRGTKAQLEGK